jgi:general L-amino acid transport system substrate-binding protein
MAGLATLAAAGLAWGLACGLAGLLALGAAPAQAEPTLAAVKARGQLQCGINGQLPGFSVQNEHKEWTGLEIDYCAERFDALRDGRIDVLMRNTTASLERTAGTNVRDVTVIYVDAQLVVVPKALNVKELAELDGKTVCTLRGTPYLPRLQEWFAERKRAVVPLMFDTQREMYQAFYDGKCAGITQANVDEQLRSPLPAVRRLLGVAPVNGKLLGLDEGWACRAIKQVGNYSEIYERNVGKGSALKFARGVNALWSRGGVMFPLPMQ